MMKRSPELLTDFAKRYYKATHPLELTKMGVSGSGDIILTIILIIFTAGVGAAAKCGHKSQTPGKDCLHPFKTGQNPQTHRPQTPTAEIEQKRRRFC